MKRTIIILLVLGIISLFFNGCEMIDYHPYDVDIQGKTNLNNKNITKIENNCKDKDTIRFVVMGDTQSRYDDTEDFVNQLNTLDNIDFVIHGGDISDFGMTDEFLLQRDIMNKLDIPYVVLIGNHDCIGNGEETFMKVFGKLNFSFIAGDTKFVCLNTNAMESDYSNPIPDFHFIEKELSFRKDNFSKTIFVMHAPPYNDQFNNNVAKVFQDTIKTFPNLLFCVHSHLHSLSISELFHDGVKYYGSDSIAHRNYLIFTITPEGYEDEVVYF